MAAFSDCALDQNIRDHVLFVQNRVHQKDCIGRRHIGISRRGNDGWVEDTVVGQQREAGHIVRAEGNSCEFLGEVDFLVRHAG